MKFIAKDLNDVADAFDKKAAEADRWAGAAKAAIERRTAEIEARTWRAAAQQLRDTELQA